MASARTTAGGSRTTRQRHRLQSKPHLKLFLVARWGGAVDGPDGIDTVLIVAAHSVRQASGLADAALGSGPTSGSGFANVIDQIGTATAVWEEPTVILGPFQQMAAWRGRHKWFREVRRLGWHRWGETHPRLKSGSRKSRRSAK